MFCGNDCISRNGRYGNMKDKFGLDLNVGNIVMFAILSDVEIGEIVSYIPISRNIKVKYKNNNNYHRILKPNKVVKVNKEEHLLFEYMINR